MNETWLRNNARAFYLGMALPALLLVGGLVVASGLGGRIEATWLRAVGGALAGLGLAVMLNLAREARKPRLGYDGEHLLVNLGARVPYAVPIGVVEAFLLGQAPSQLPGRQYERTETRSITIKLADSATEWEHVEVKVALGKWCGGYITILGTWCEPLNLDVVRRLNARLAEVTRPSHVG